MKYCVLVLLLLTCSTHGRSQKGNHYTLEGTIGKYVGSKEPLMLYFGQSYDPDTQKLVVDDSCKLSNGRFEFKGVAPEPIFVFFELVNASNPAESSLIDWGSAWLEKGNIVLTSKDSLTNAVIKGSSVLDESIAFGKQTAALKKRMEELNELRYEKKADSFFINHVFIPESQRNYDSLMLIRRNYIDAHPKSYYSLFLFDDIVWEMNGLNSVNRLTTDMIKETMDLYNGLDKQIQQTGRGKKVKKELEEMRLAGKIGVGDAVVHFTSKGINGENVDTRKLLGKVYLIDFWGSWCGWCRKGHPHLKELYEQYKDKGFEILGVSAEGGTDERHVKNWKKAVKDDGLPWLQVLNGKGMADLTIT